MIDVWCAFFLHDTAVARALCSLGGHGANLSTMRPRRRSHVSEGAAGRGSTSEVATTSPAGAAAPGLGSEIGGRSLDMADQGAGGHRQFNHTT